jgi:hypothetical protein
VLYVSQRSPPLVERLTDEANLCIRLLASHQRYLLRRANSAIFLVCATTKNTPTPLETASCPLVTTRAHCVRISFRSPHFRCTYTLTPNIVTQAWQMRACQAPLRDAGPMTRRINLALVVIATICVAIRFIARWRIQDSNIGWDDWTILASYVLIIPSTVILQISSFPVSALALLCGLC